MDFNISNLIMNIGENTKGIDWVNPMAVLITGIITSFISLFIFCMKSLYVQTHNTAKNTRKTKIIAISPTLIL